MCGGIVNDDFVAYSLMNLQWTNFDNRSTFGEVMDNIMVDCFFDSQCRSNKHKTTHRDNTNNPLSKIKLSKVPELISLSTNVKLLFSIMSSA